MMVRSKLDTVRAQLADAAHLPHEEVAAIAWQLLGELERSRIREDLTLALCVDLVLSAPALIP